MRKIHNTAILSNDTVDRVHISWNKTSRLQRTNHAMYNILAPYILSMPLGDFQSPRPSKPIRHQPTGCIENGTDVNLANVSVKIISFFLIFFLYLFAFSLSGSILGWRSHDLVCSLRYWLTHPNFGVDRSTNTFHPGKKRYENSEVESGWSRRIVSWELRSSPNSDHSR